MHRVVDSSSSRLGKNVCKRLLLETKNGTLENIQIVQHCWPGKPEEREGDEGLGEIAGAEKSRDLIEPFGDR